MFPLQLSQFCTDTEEAKSSGVSNLCIGKPPGSFRPAAHQKAKNTEFGYSRKDVLIIGVSIFGGGFAMYYGLQAGGLSPGIAGNFVQLFVVLGLCIGWIGSYIFRVANKDMTYVKQLENYEEEVMAKRLEEMPESEREKLMASVEAEKQRRQARQQQSK
ncbi:TPA: hypothetical protein ACH3X3_006947 [Trebouxia sp. C0006]